MSKHTFLIDGVSALNFARLKVQGTLKQIPMDRVFNISEMSTGQARRLIREQRSAGFKPVVMCQMAHAVLVNEDVVTQFSRQGALMASMNQPVAIMKDIVAILKSIQVVTEAEGTAPKLPTEAERIRIRQKQDALSLKKRQTSELLGAQQRDLEKKARDTANKINKPKLAESLRLKLSKS